MKVKKLFISLIIIMIFNLIYIPITVASDTNQITLSSEASNFCIYAPCALLIERRSGDILYQKDAYRPMHPASTVKIMTAILVLENCNLDEIVTISESAISLVPSGYVTSDIQAGEILSVRDLLYTMLIPSGNDAANVLAEYVGGNIENFAHLMNEKALELGCKNSNFTNPSGIHDPNMYTTSYDLYLIANYAMEFEQFRTIVSTPTYTLPSTNVYPEADRVFHNSNHLIHNTSQYYYEYATGIKTGYTNAAQNCLVSSAKIDDVEFIAVILGSTFDNTSNKAKFIDAKTLFDFGFTYYYEYYQSIFEKHNMGIWSGIFNLDLEKNFELPELLLDKNNKPKWGYILYLIARAILILIIIIYILFRIVKKFKRYHYNRTHAKYNYKY